MALTKDQKTAQLNELVTKLKDADSVMFSHYIGLSVGDVSEFRNQLRESGAEMKVAKKTLICLAFKEAGYPDVTPDDMEGPIACIFSFEDPLSGAQTAFKFSKDHDQVTLVGGVFDGKLLSKEQAMELAQMPGREELLGKFVGMLRSPLVSFASLCSSPLSSFARGLSQVAEKGGFSEEESGKRKEEKEEVEDAPVTEENPKEDSEPEAAPAAEENTESETAPDPDSKEKEAE